MTRTTLMYLLAAAGLTAGAETAQAQWPGGRVPGGGWGWGPGVAPGRYFGPPGGTNFNPVTRSVYRPWAGTVTKPSGTYFYVPGTGAYTPWGRVPGTGVYQNRWSGGVYNPRSGFYAPGW
jgi:hypothetical protein